MRQTLFYIPSEIFGYPLFGFGLFLAFIAVSLLLSGIVHFARIKKLDESAWHYLGLLVVGVIVSFVMQNVAKPGHGLPIRGYGTFLLLAIFSSFSLLTYLGRKKNLTVDQIFSLATWSVVSGILGARIFYVVEYWREMLRWSDDGTLNLFASIFSTLNFVDGGLVVFGSIIGGTIGALLFMRLNRLPIFSTFDAMAPAMFLGIAIGRIGCLMNGCCFGGICDAPWAITFPEGSPAHFHQIGQGETFYFGLILRDENAPSGENRVVIREVQLNSDADKNGLKKGMLIKSVAGLIHGQYYPVPIDTALNTLGTIQELHEKYEAEKIRFDVEIPPNILANDQTLQKSFVAGPTPSTVRPVHPTQLYSSTAAFCGCLILLLLGRLKFYRQRDGLTLATFLILYGVGRFIIEIIRTDEASFFDTGLTVSQNVSIAAVVIGLVLAGFLLRKPAAPASFQRRV